MFQSCEKSISRKNPVLHRKTITLQHLTVQFLLYYLSGGRLRPGGKNKKISNFNSKSTRSRSLTRGGRLQEVPNIVIWLGNVWYLENWTLRRGGRLQEVVATGDSTVFSKIQIFRPKGREGGTLSPWCVT